MDHYKRIPLAFVFVMATLAVAQDKPTIFVAGRGTENLFINATGNGSRWFRTGHVESTTDSHDESMEVTKNLQKECPDIAITLSQSSADYTVTPNREAKQKRGLLRSNSQMQVANRVGDVLGSRTTRTVNNASRDACTLILSDWTQNGRITPQAERPADPPAPADNNVPSTTVVRTPATQETPEEEQARAGRNTVVVSAGPTPPVQSDSVADAARRVKQHHACIKLAAANPNVTCK